MSENIIPKSSGRNHRLGQNLRLTSLAPVFKRDRHQLYFDLLVRAVTTKGVQNVALTGAYGTGKSSIIAKLSADYKKRVVELSLSTIAPEVHDVSEAEPGTAQETSGSRTNQIQKEIVKQLLYRLPPGSVPRSRFRRASAPNKVRDWTLAVALGGATLVVLFALGILQPLVQGVLPVEALLPALWRQVVAYVLLLALAVGAAWAVMSLIRARPMMSASMQAGPATVTLSKQSDTYFDEYLDEIVYFFQASRRDLVVIEDVDRFEDVQVFDTLRALNGLLNSSDQIGRRIVFIYAIRDSVFEQIGEKQDHSNDEVAQQEACADRAKATLKRASRTKFFDVIIPVIPFISADNARDVMSETMESEDFEIEPALIRVAARHVADMRMIDNIRNEFEVYRNRLVVPEDPEEPIPGINDDLVFAIILFKNTHLADFEKIRHRDSTLDQLYSVWRNLVRENLAKYTLELSEYRESRHLEVTMNARAARLGHRLAELRDILQAAAGAANPQATVELSGPATPENVESPEVWSQIVSGVQQNVTFRNLKSRPQPSIIEMSFSVEQLTTLLGMRVSPEEWNTVDLREVDANIKKVESRLRFLRHHTWEELCARPEFTVDPSSFELKDSSGELIKKPVSFNDIVEAVLESDLARELVRHGFLTSHFALHASSYYGNHLGPEAIEYIRRCIEPGTPDASFAMSETDVIQLLREQDAERSDTADLFRDASVFNVSILDYLLAKRPAAAATVSQRLSLLGNQEQEFIDTYVTQGQHAGDLLVAMAPHWSGVIRYAALTAPLDPDSRPALLDTILRSLSHDQFDVDREVGQVLRSSYRDIGAIYAPDSADHAEIVFQLLRASDAVLESLEPLNDAARDVAVNLRLFPITATNLKVLVPTDVVALDVLRSDRDAYTYVLDRIEDYLAIVDTSPTMFRTLLDPTMFSTVLSEATERSHASLLKQLVDMSGPDCRVDDLGDVPAETWPFLTGGRRTAPTFANTSAYLEQFSMDAHLGALLNKHKTITDGKKFSVDDRRAVAIVVLNARQEIPSTSTRVRIATSMAPGRIAATSIAPEGGDLVARLLKQGLLADDVTAFSDDLMVDWTTLETTIAASKTFATFVSPDVLDASNIPSLLRSSVIPIETKKAVVSEIASYLTSASSSQALGVAGALANTGWGLPYGSLEALRAAGVPADQLIALIVRGGDQLSTEQLKALLQAFGGEYTRVAHGGRGRPTFDLDPDHEYVLRRLVGDTVKQVETKNFKLKGPRLVAPLRQPGA